MILSLLHDLIKNPCACPGKIGKFNNSDFPRLIEHITAHKLEAFNYHLYTCKSCKTFFSKNQLRTLKSQRKQKLLLTKLHTSEIKALKLIFKKNAISAYLPKDLRWLSVYKNTHLFQTWSDIDIFVTHSQFSKANDLLQKNSWDLVKENEKFSRFTNYRWQENIYSKKRVQLIKIDLQYSAGTTYNSLLSLVTKVDLINFSNKAVSKAIFPGLNKPPKDVQFTLAIVHFFFHDKCFGFRQAFEIKEVASTLSISEWQSSLKFVKKQGLENFFWFVLLILEKFFNKKLIPNEFKTNIKTKSLLSAQLYPLLNLQYFLANTGLRIGLVKIYADILSGLANI